VTTLKKEMEFEYAFVKAGGLLMAGADPTRLHLFGNAGVSYNQDLIALTNHEVVCLGNRRCRYRDLTRSDDGKSNS
jgi:hypothetical protein